MKNFYILSILLLVTCFSCSEELLEKDNSSEKNINNSVLQQNKNTKDALNSKSELLNRFKNLQINWESEVDINSHVKEYQTNREELLEKNNDTLYAKYTLRTLQNKEGNQKLILSKYISKKRHSIINEKNLGEISFTGTEIRYNFNGKAEKTIVYINGKKSNIHTRYDINNNNSNKYAPADDCLEGCYIMLWVQHWTDWYDGGGNYTSSSDFYKTTEWVWVGGTGTSYTPDDGPYHDHHPGSPADPVDSHAIEILKDPTFEDTKVDCIYEKLNTASNTFREIIKKFDGEFPVSHLKFSMVDDIPSEDPNEVIAAHTKTPEDYVTEIQFNKQFFNSNYSDITFARTIIHEVIHAEMYRKLLSLTQTPNYELNASDVELLKDNFPGMFDYYSRYFYDEYKEAYYNGTLDETKLKYFDKIGNDWQHELMASHYIDIMSQALYDFAGGTYSIEECEKFALADFKNTVAWDSVKDKSDIENLTLNILIDGLKNCF